MLFGQSDVDGNGNIFVADNTHINIDTINTRPRHWLRNDNLARSYAPAKAAPLRVSINTSKAGQKICVWEVLQLQ